MAESRSVVVRLSVDTAQAIRDSKQFGDEFERAMQRSEQGAGRASKAVDELGSTAGKIGLVAAGALAAAGKAAMDWESQFAGVEKTVDGTVDQMAALEDELRELARTMPATHQEIAATAEAAGQLGVAREDVADFTETMIQLGETTNLTADEAATSIAQMANVLGTSQGDIDNVGAALVALGNDGASTEAQILGMAQRIAGAGAQIGLAESDILAIANAAASMGVEVEAGGSSISRVFTEMAKATAQGGDDLAAFAKVAGVSAQEFVRSFKDDPAQAFASFTQGLDRINKSGGDVFTTLDELQLSDVRVSQALLGMAASGDLLTDSLALGAEAFGENTALAEEYAKRADTTAAEVQVAWNNIKDAGIEAGAALLPIISEVSDDVSSMAQAFGKLPDPVQSSVTQLLALTAIVGGAAWFGSKTIGAITSTRTALAELAEISPRAASGLSRVARTAVGLAAVASAVTLLGDAVASASGAKLDLSDLSRDLEAIANGSSSEALTRVVDDLKITGSTMNNAADYLFEAVAFVSPLSDKTGLDNAQDNIKAIDQELAALVESGNGDKARVIFEAIVAQLNGLPAGASVSQSAIDGVIESFSSYETALGNAAASGAEVGAGAGEAAEGIGEVGGAAGGAAIQVQDLIDALDGLLSPRLNLAEASDQWQDGLRNLTDSLAENSRSLVGNTDAASTNRAAIRDQVRNLLDVTKAQADAGAGTDELTETMRRGRQAILDAGKAANISEDDMKDYLQVLGLTPEQIRTTVQALTREANANLDETQGKVNELDRSTANPKVNAEVAAAKSAMQSVLDFLNILDGKTATTYVTTRRVNTGGMGPQLENARGNILHFANGDVANAHQPELYRGGVTRVWGEPETGGEAYIPLRNDGRRPRARAIATETVRLLGGTARFADGGINGGRTLDDRGEILELRRSIRDLTRSLKENGKDALRGLDRKIAANDLAQTRRDLRIATRPPSLSGRDARQAIDLEAGMSASDIRQEYADFKRVLREAGIELPKNFDKLREKSLTTAERFEKVSKRIEETEEALTDWRETAANIAFTVGSMFNNNAFGLEGGGLANALLQLEADRNDTAERNALLQGVTGLVDTLGLDKSSEAYQAIATGADMQTLRDLDTAAEVQSFFELFNSRLQEQTAAGEFAANAVTGAQIQALESTLTLQNATLDNLTKQLERQEQRLEDAATRGTREGSRQGVQMAWSDQERVKTAKAKSR